MTPAKARKILQYYLGIEYRNEALTDFPVRLYRMREIEWQALNTLVNHEAD